MQQIAWVSPLVDGHFLKTAHYSQAVLRSAAAEGNATFELFVDDTDLAELGEAQFCGCPVFHYHRFHERLKEKSFAAVYYQLENNARCCFVSDCAATWPGIVCLHDCNLLEMYFSKFRFATGPTDYNDTMDTLFGPGSIRWGDYHVRNWPTEALNRIYHTCAPELSSAAAVAVFAESHLRIVKQLVKEKPIFLASKATELLPVRNNSAGDVVTVAISGGLWLEDQLGLLLEVLSELMLTVEPSNWPMVCWLVADPQSKVLAEKSVSRFFGAEPAKLSRFKVTLVDSLSSLRRELTSSDCYIGTKFGQGAGLDVCLLESLALGVPAVVANYGPYTDLPEAVSPKVHLGTGEVRELRTLLESVVSDGLAFSSQAQQFAETVLSPKQALADLLTIQRKAAPALSQARASRLSDYRNARAQLLCELGLDSSDKTGIEQALTDVVKTVAEELNWEG